MGVMITAPANNFERHMLPVAFVFGFVCLQFWRESRNARLAVNANVVSEYEPAKCGRTNSDCVVVVLAVTLHRTYRSR